jgi:3-methyladenine DNA glycosylase AlkD
MNINYKTIEAKLQQLANPEIAKISQRFFKTGAGHYGEGDLFIGIKVPVLRGLIKEFRGANLEILSELLRSPRHEERLLALYLLIDFYQRGDAQAKTTVYQIYLAHTRFINNWDLVDTSAPQIVGHYLFDKPRHILDDLAHSTSLWERRIAILATFYFIRQNQFDDTLRLAECLLKDQHDLIHKAIGWMLREVGKRDQAQTEAFLRKHYHQLPRTTLRYAIERMPSTLRQQYLLGEFL